MLKLKIFIIALTLGLGGERLARAAEGAVAPAVLESAQPQSVSGGADALEDQDVYYAPEESGDSNGVMGGSQGAVGSLPGSASYLSRARIIPFAWGHPQEPLKDVELFLNGQYLGKGPLTLENYMVKRAQLELSAHKEGYDEAQRPKVALPVEGDVRIALMDDSAASWYTTPAWLVGLGLVGGAVGAYNSGSNGAGLGLAGAGVSIIALSQLGARFMHLPALRRQVEEYNQRIEPNP